MSMFLQLLSSWLGRWDFIGGRVDIGAGVVQPFDRSCERGSCGGED